MAELEDLDEPEEELGYWEDGELIPEEPPDPVLWPQAEGSVPDLIDAVLAASGDPALMTDAELVESLAAWHAVGSRAAGREYRATEELLRRRKPRVWDRRADRAENAREESSPDAADAPERVMPAVVPSREAGAEIALALTATEYAANAQAELAAILSRRLPAAFGELDAGRADLTRVRRLAEAVQFLSDEDAGRVDALLAPSLGKMTTGDLRDKARKAVFRIDAEAADRRREHAERKARFALYGNDDHTATAAIERMPSHLGAAAKARVNAIARAAKAAGMTDPMPLLQAKVATGLLLGTLPWIPPPADDDSAPGPPPGGPSGWPGDWLIGPTGPAAPAAPADDEDRAPEDDGTTVPGQEDQEPEPREDPGPEDPGFADARPKDAGSGEPGSAASAMTWPPIPAQAAAAAPGCLGLPLWLRPKDQGRIKLIVPWRTLAGMGQEPGELSWIGPVTPAQARELAVAAAADAGCTWRLIVTDEEGRAIAITTLRARRATRAGPPGLAGEVTITISQALAATLGRGGQVIDWVARGFVNIERLTSLLAEAVPAANLVAAEAADRSAADREVGGCAHTMEVSGYRVPDTLRRWLNTRDGTCRNPICRQPAARCDQDHTIAYHRGGRTCPCDLGGLCRTHHELKQLPGWHLTQDTQGYFTWRTPSGLTYRKDPHRYAV